MAGLGLSQIRCFWSVADQKHEFEIVAHGERMGRVGPAALLRLWARVPTGARWEGKRHFSPGVFRAPGIHLGTVRFRSSMRTEKVPLEALGRPSQRAPAGKDALVSIHRSSFFVPAVVFTLSVFAVRLGDPVVWMWRDQPIVGVLLLGAAVVFWLLVLRQVRHARPPFEPPSTGQQQGRGRR
jgi:hypothetical protein